MVMEVFVLTVVWQMDSGECGSELAVFDSIDKAQKEFKKEIKKAKQDFKQLDTEHTPLADGDMSYSIWEREEYCYNHIDINIVQTSIK